MIRTYTSKASRSRPLAAIVAERIRQDELRDEGRFMYTLADHGMPDTGRLAAIVEEVGEVARESLGDLVEDAEGVEKLYDELTQVAALALAWMEGIDARLARPPLPEYDDFYGAPK